jgi:hypothetical protein
MRQFSEIQFHFRVAGSFLPRAVHRRGFTYAGSAASQGVLSLADDDRIGKFASENCLSEGPTDAHRIPVFRITINDRLQPSERFVTLAHELGHIFCGHLGACTSQIGKDEESGWPDRRWVGRNYKIKDVS